MIPVIDETHDPALRSWVEGSAPGRSPFPIQNLPLGVFSAADRDGPRVGVRIGDTVLDLKALHGEMSALAPEARSALHAPSLAGYMALPAVQRRAVRGWLSAFLRAGRDDAETRARALNALVPVERAEMHLPARIGCFVDFYACLNHAVTAGTVLRRGEPAPLLPNWKWMPLAYHGRASSIQVGGTPVRRPSGQIRKDRTQPPVLAPTRELDYEVELGAFVGQGCPRGQVLGMDAAADHIAGFVLVNDWSARDIQTWEGGPLGPLQSKSFATSISPWLVTAEALAPFRAPRHPRAGDDPAPLPHLDGAEDRARGGLDITLSAAIRTAAMAEPVRVSAANAQELYWSVQQMAVHLASNGSGLEPGDLFASGTISGTTDGTRGCLLEITQRGRVPLALGGERRGFLEDGDTVILTARCEREGFAPIGFGECTTRIDGGGTPSP